MFPTETQVANVSFDSDDRCGYDPSRGFQYLPCLRTQYMFQSMDVATILSFGSNQRTGYQLWVRFEDSNWVAPSTCFKRIMWLQTWVLVLTEGLVSFWRCVNELEPCFEGSSWLNTDDLFPIDGEVANRWLVSKWVRSWTMIRVMSLTANRWIASNQLSGYDRAQCF